ncbi:MAG: Imidazole glycerol phosphate synthase subunit HisH 1 [Alphaproteobacteria bacterium MarineAlpha5_Bin9]|nr:MAG: Imidazole glycerol phosphate synthase subunit HisH 1 [Alphaproteobacteria bacterium MarineAlpha5_Bin9]|tara:strand:+ start:2006 stop:2635 length:630 start_codon:yes stop_codon:yes gene_type:complete
MKDIIVLDYGLGNIKSVYQAIKKTAFENKISAKVKISNNVSDLDSSSHIVLPGQGAFKSCMDGLKSIPGIIDTLKQNVLVQKKPFFGICVGMQLLAKQSYENGKHEGLGWIDGEILKLPEKKLKLPHIGWNEVILTNPKNIFENFINNDYYFVHSYYFNCKDKNNEIAKTNYVIDFSSIVGKENIYGVQFHPEKSSDQGQAIISKFLSL